MITALQESFRWLLQGVATIPVWLGSKHAALSEWRDYQTRLPTLEELALWFSRPRNLGVITGWRGLVVLDFDNRDLFFTWWNQYRLSTYMVATPRGVHVYLYSEERLNTRKLQDLDIKAAGGYVLAPPSIHPSRVAYQVLCNSEILHVESALDYLPPGIALPEKQDNVTQYKGVTLPQPPAAADPWDQAEWAGQPGRDLITLIRAKIDILSLFPNARRSGQDDRWYLAHCPLHDDRDPSLWIDTRRGICGCYAGCNGGRPMDVINLVARLNHQTDREAIFYLAKLL